MSCPSNTKGRAVAAVIAVAAALSGCSDIYFDRRETISPAAGDALRANQVTHMVDPWPRSSANRNIAFNGEVMQRAVERYRDGRVIPPINATTSTTYGRAQAAAASAPPPPPAGSAPPQPSAPSGWASTNTKQP